MGLRYSWPAGDILTSYDELHDNGDVSESPPSRGADLYVHWQVQLTQVLAVGKLYNSRNSKEGTT